MTVFVTVTLAEWNRNVQSTTVFVTVTLSEWSRNVHSVAVFLTVTLPEWSKELWLYLWLSPYQNEVEEMCTVWLFCDCHSIRMKEASRKPQTTNMLSATWHQKQQIPEPNISASISVYDRFNPHASCAEQENLGYKCTTCVSSSVPIRSFGLEHSWSERDAVLKILYVCTSQSKCTVLHRCANYWKMKLTKAEILFI